jgi:hypothetical protein
VYNAVNPFDWMELISLQGKTKCVCCVCALRCALVACACSLPQLPPSQHSFFEKRVGDYQKAGVMNGTRATKASNHEFSLDAEF